MGDGASTATDELTELVSEPESGRVFEQELGAGIADADAGGRVRVDAVARWLQDLAYADMVDSGFEGRGAWIVRKLRLRVASWPRVGERLSARTFCSGLGRFAAERRSTLAGESARVEAIALWVYLDPVSLRPLRFEEDFPVAYAETAAGRSAHLRLRHPAPEGVVRRDAWTFRATDIDIAGHVNNSHYWGPLEQAFGAAPPPGVDAEIEHRSAAGPGEVDVLHGAGAVWIADPGGDVQASILWHPLT